MTKGKALIEARGILGPATTVGPAMGEIRLDLTPVVAYAGSWEEALERAATLPQAKVWSEESISRDNAIAAAEESLKKLRASTNKQRVLDFFKDLAARFKARQEQKATSDAEYTEWKQKREERFQ